MKNNISVLIVDDNLEFASLLRDHINGESDMYVIGMARDGLEAIEMIKELKPDVAILDVVMPNLDGLGVLEKLSSTQLNPKPLFIMLSAIGQDVFIQRSIQLGAEYYFVKPFDITVMITRIKQMFRERYVTVFPSEIAASRIIMPMIKQKPDHSYDLEIEVTNLMREIGVPPHMAGYQYIREAVIQAVKNSRVFTSITKVLYPAVAKKFCTTPEKVERAIRNTIECTWARGNADSIDSLFGYTVNYVKGKPTNSEFIAMMADKVRVNSGRGVGK